MVLLVVDIHSTEHADMLSLSLSSSIVNKLKWNTKKKYIFVRGATDAVVCEIINCGDDLNNAQILLEFTALRCPFTLKFDELNDLLTQFEVFIEFSGKRTIREATMIRNPINLNWVRNVEI